MTPPHDGTPTAPEHAALAAALVAVLDLRTGLSAALGDAAGQGARVDDHELLATQHQRLVDDLTTALPQPALAAILTDHAPPAALASDLAIGLNLEEGLATALASVATTPAGLVLDQPGADNNTDIRVRGQQLESLIDALSALYQAPPTYRLRLRAGTVHRALRQSHRAIADIRAGLDRVSPDGPPAFLVQETRAVVGDQRQRLDRLTTVLVTTAMDRRGGVSKPVRAALTSFYRRLAGQDRRTQALAQVARTVADGDPTRAEAIARTMTDPALQARALTEVARTVAAAGDPARAEAIARTITDPALQARALTGVAGMLLSDGDPARAEAIARTITDPALQAQALTEVARTVAAAGRSASTQLVQAPGFREVNDAQFQALEEVPASSSVSLPTATVSSTVAALIATCADALIELRDRWTRQPPASAGRRELADCQRQIGDLARLLDALWQVLSDFCGADLHAAADLVVEDLDGVRWSGASVDLGATRWPDDLRETVDSHSVPVHDRPGVYEIHYGTPVQTNR